MLASRCMRAWRHFWAETKVNAHHERPKAFGDVANECMLAWLVRDVTVSNRPAASP